MKERQTYTQCDSEKLNELLLGSLSPEETAFVESHLSECASCAEQIQMAAVAGTSWNEAQSMLALDEFDGLPSLSSAKSLFPAEVGDREYTPTADLLAREIRGWLDPTDDPQMLGRFAGYEIVGIIGHGGMGIVLKGFEASLNRYVAIKVLAPRLAANGAARQRFAREAQAAAAVLHDNVVAIHRVDEFHGLPFLVMPYIADISLQKRINDEGPLPLAAVLRIGSQIAAGLAAAHHQGLVHRDIKPANIMLEKGVERVTITDFGLARTVDDASLTRTGLIAGTPQYMSPEQARGESVDQRSDLFSLGSVLHTMCTGRAPFRAETSYGVLRRITDEGPEPIQEINPDIPEWLCGIIARLMSKQPDDRFVSAREVAELLEECLAHIQQPTVVPLPHGRLCAERNQPHRASGRFSREPWVSARRLILRRSIGVITMIAVLGFALLGMFLWQSADPPDIAGRWTGEQWGNVLLEQKRPGRYEGTYTGSKNAKFGTVDVKWSRLERRFNGTWRDREGDRNGKISLRLVDNEIRGAWRTSKKAATQPDSPRLADLLWVRAAKTQLANTRMRVLGANGRPVAGNAVVRGTKGYFGPNLPKWSETPSHHGLVSLGKLAAGTHWFLVNFGTVLRIELPAAEELIEPSLPRPRPRSSNLIGKDHDVKVTVEAEDGVEIIAIEIHNRTTEAIQLTEANLQLWVAIKAGGIDARVLSPLWNKVADGEALPETTIEPDQTATLRLNWPDWVKHGFWFSRDHEIRAEPVFLELEPGRTWVRVTPGSARPVSVTHPDRIIASGNGKRDWPASERTLELLELVTRKGDPWVATTYYLETSRQRLFKKRGVTAGVTVIDLSDVSGHSDVTFKVRLFLPHVSRRGADYVAANSVHLWVSTEELRSIAGGQRFVRAFYYPKDAPQGSQLLKATTLDPKAAQPKWLAETEKLGDLIAVVEITRDTKPATPKHEVSDFERLQGVWLLGSEEQFGHVQAVADPGQEPLRVVIDGRTLRGCFDAPWKPIVWRLEFDNETKPQAMYLAEINGESRKRSVRFRLRDDALGLCFDRRNPERLPVEFGTAQGSNAIIWHLRRPDAEEALNVDAEPRADPEKAPGTVSEDEEFAADFQNILGHWDVVSVEGSGGRFMSLSDQSNPGDRLVIAHVETPNGRLWLSGALRDTWSRDGSLHLHPEADPSRLTFKARDGKRNHFADTNNPPHYGIYRIEGNELTILAGDPRDFTVNQGTESVPTERRSEDGTTSPGGRAVWSWKSVLPNYAPEFQLEKGQQQILVKLRRVALQSERKETTGAVGPSTRPTSPASTNALPTGNFAVYASSPQLAKEIERAAEKHRRALAVSWFGDPVQDWEDPCLVRILEGEDVRPNVEFDADDWQLSLQAPRRRMIESLLPRGVLHALFATRFQQPVPLWAVEGAGITVETPAERAEYDKMLVEFLTSNRGIAFNRLFAMEEHPADYSAMLAQSHSIVQFLVNQHGRRQFIAFLEDGVESKDWPAAVHRHYAFPDLSALQLAWTEHVRASHHQE